MIFFSIDFFLIDHSFLIEFCQVYSAGENTSSISTLSIGSQEKKGKASVGQVILIAMHFHLWAGPRQPQPRLSVFYRDILRKQYITWFGNIRKYCDTSGYHDIFTVFFMHDISHFWPFMDQLTIAIH